MAHDIHNMDALNTLIDNIEKVIVGKREVIRLAVTCLVAGGHLLIEDVPGTGKTTLAMAIARSIEADFSRIQFTADILPTDITGISVFDQEKKRFEFRRGPIFHNIVLADEINRGTPRAQSGLLEAMNEQQVSADGQTYDLPRPFLVIATQNPLTFAGTYPLLAAQLDRFLIRLSLGYLSPQEEIAMIKNQRNRHPLQTLEAVLHEKDVQDLQDRVKKVTVDDAIYQYIVNLVNRTRNVPELQFGVSHRGTLALFQAVRAYALVQGRDYVLPVDVKKLFLPTLAHRIAETVNYKRHNYVREFLKKILQSVPSP